MGALNYEMKHLSKKVGPRPAENLFENKLEFSFRFRRPIIYQLIVSCSTKTDWTNAVNSSKREWRNY